MKQASVALMGLWLVCGGLMYSGAAWGSTAENAQEAQKPSPSAEASPSIEVNLNNSCASLLLALPRVTQLRTQYAKAKAEAHASASSPFPRAPNLKQFLFKGRSKRYPNLKATHDLAMKEVETQLLQPLLNQFLTQNLGFCDADLANNHVHMQAHSKLEKLRKTATRCAAVFASGFGSASVSLHHFDTIRGDVVILGLLIGWFISPWMDQVPAQRSLFVKNLVFDLNYTAQYKHKLPQDIKCRMVLYRKKATHQLQVPASTLASSVYIQNLEVPIKINCSPQLLKRNTWRGHLRLTRPGEPSPRLVDGPLQASLHFTP